MNDETDTPTVDEAAAARLTDAPPPAEEPPTDSTHTPEDLAREVEGMLASMASMFKPPAAAPEVIMDGDYMYLVEGHSVVRTFKAVKGRGERSDG